MKIDDMERDYNFKIEYIFKLKKYHISNPKESLTDPYKKVNRY